MPRTSSELGASQALQLAYSNAAMVEENPPLTNQASWTVFIPSNAASMKVISVLRMQNLEMGEWLQLKKPGKHVGKLVLLCQTFRSGSLATGCHVQAAN